jgi:hypothetical protein
MVFGIIPERRSASVRKERSASPESPSVTLQIGTVSVVPVFAGMSGAGQYQINFPPG